MYVDAFILILNLIINSYIKFYKKLSEEKIDNKNEHNINIVKDVGFNLIRHNDWNGTIYYNSKICDECFCDNNSL